MLVPRLARFRCPEKSSWRSLTCLDQVANLDFTFVCTVRSQLIKPTFVLNSAKLTRPQSEGWYQRARNIICFLLVFVSVFLSRVPSGK